MHRPRTFFILSPAHSGGKRARQLTRPDSTLDLSVRLRTSGAALGDVYAFMSALYFRGKLAYATAFAHASPAAVTIIVPGRGLLAPDQPVTDGDLAAFGDVPVDPRDPRYRDPLIRDLRRLDQILDDPDRVVLLGSIATGKYVDPMLEVLSSRVWFPRDFVGRGDMSRGGLLLRSAAAGCELEYIPVEGAARTGPRPPRLDDVVSRHARPRVRPERA